MVNLSLVPVMPVVTLVSAMPWFSNGVDMAVMTAIVHTRNAIGDAIFHTISVTGNAAMVWIVIGALIVGWGLLCPPGYARTNNLITGVLLWCGLGLSAVLVEGVLKPRLERPRPIEVNPDWNSFDLVTVGSSFPSGHTAWAFLAVPLLWAWDVRAGKAGLVFAILMGFSRMYTGAHWLTDVLVGAGCGLALGGVLAALGTWLSRGLSHRD